MKSIFLIGVIMVFGAIFFAVIKYKVYKVESKGEVVVMQIQELPKYCGLTKSKYYMKVRYEDQIFSKRIPGGYCNSHKVGEDVSLKYLEGNDSILFPDESIKGDFIAISLFFIVGILAIGYGFFHKN